MSSLHVRTLILTFCRVMQYAVGIIGPIVLTRVLDVRSYGQYREFLLYALLLSTFMRFSIPGSLLYFIPKYPERSKEHVSSTASLLLFSASIGGAATWLFGDYIRSRTSFDFVGYLIIYLIFFVNLSFLETFWLAQKRSDKVLYFSMVMVVTRLASVVLAAVYLKDIISIVVVLIIVEVARVTLSFLYLMSGRLLTWKGIAPEMMQQLRYVGPLGIATVIFFFNQQYGRLFIAGLSPEDLAIFSVGSTQLPVIGIVRSSISDVIFPEMAAKGKRAGLRLWQRANILYCFLVFPASILLFYYADVIVGLVFPEGYSAAVPIMRVYIFLMVRQCFELGSVLRAVNENRYFVTGNVVSLIAVLALTGASYDRLGIVGPAVAFVLADLVLAAYLTSKIIKVYETSLSSLFMWKKVFILAGVSIAGIPLLFLGDSFGLFGMVFAFLSYLALYFGGVSYFRIKEVDSLVSKLSALRRKYS